MSYREDDHETEDKRSNIDLRIGTLRARHCRVHEVECVCNHVTVGADFIHQNSIADVLSRQLYSINTRP
jgi:hypothetical protein